jgi:hypothetical protein
VDVISLRAAGKLLGEDPRVVKGMALALGIKLMPAPPNSLLMSRRDLNRLKRRMQAREEDACACAS